VPSRSNSTAGVPRFSPFLDNGGVLLAERCWCRLFS
jgi:hypothetical protein